MQLVHKGLAQHGAAIFAHEQTAGKGQRGRQWHSQAGENIILSVILNTSELQVSSQFLLSMATALAVYDFFNSYVIDETAVKWPNDLYWRDRKAGGILIESIVTGKEWQWAVVGIGINVNQVMFNEDVTNAVSLKQITGKHYKPIELAKEVCNFLHTQYQRLLNESSKSIITAYNDVLYKKGQVVTLKKNSAVFNCTVKGVNAFGQLITESATEQLFNVGEVQWVI
ncbi:biotin--[acetyl-CoA-carboxylase] ligase [Panacibacter ginsenosidivorans]|uniref:Biotin--[acetyl-CoA-carboxylase] ligase n=2 Tax=Panacibacter ginsenosidivorans TaxID=1813871 RepID=A0A5B8VG04_9BACT|nr:biotin--[acetyl-CoA-carboxylase] ligase [Panacibacter ginsenosidivorans]